MRRADKAERIGKILDDLCPMSPPFFRRRDPYTLLVSVVLSAQCTDERVREVAPHLFARASTPADMLALGVDEIREIIRPCGLADTRARHIRALSAILVDEHGGRVPDSLAALEALPGVGHKSASVMMMQAFGKPAFPVDTHIRRLATRWGLSGGRGVGRIETDLKRLFPEADWPKRHLQLIEFGRAYCPARGHDAQACPICSWASAPPPTAAAASGGV